MRKQPKAIYEAELKFGSISIPCAVLDDGTRVLRARSFAKALGSKGAGAYWQWKRQKSKKGARLPEFVAKRYLEPYISDELREKLTNPISYLTKTGGQAEGMSAILLPETCNIWLKFREKGTLTKIQEKIAQNAEIIIRGLAHVGIIALVDEATGYQDERTKKALQKILEEFIAKELQPWVKTFDDEFYKQIFRLNNWPYREDSIRRPGVIGRWTNDIVYDRLAPGVRKELHDLAERDNKGRPKHRLFRRLSTNLGHPKLREHLSAVTALMKASTDWKGFKRLLQRALPKYGTTLLLPFKDTDSKKIKKAS